MTNTWMSIWCLKYVNDMLKLCSLRSKSKKEFFSEGWKHCVLFFGNENIKWQYFYDKSLFNPLA